MNTLKLSLAAIAAAPLLLTVLPERAEAANRVYQSSICFTEMDYAGDYVFQSNGIANNSNSFGARSRRIYCPLITDDSVNGSGQAVQTPASLNGVFIDGFDGNNDPNDGVGAVRVQACRVPFTGALPTCSNWTPLRPATDATFTGPLTTNTLDADDMSVLKGGGSLEYRYLVIEMPAQGVFGRSSIAGYETF